jgi:hypothetical protein
MVEPERPPKIFLCHAHSGSVAVRVLNAGPTDADVAPWLN